MAVTTQAEQVRKPGSFIKYLITCRNFRGKTNSHQIYFYNVGPGADKYLDKKEVIEVFQNFCDKHEKGNYYYEADIYRKEVKPRNAID